MLARTSCGAGSAGKQSDRTWTLTLFDFPVPPSLSVTVMLILKVPALAYACDARIAPPCVELLPLLELPSPHWITQVHGASSTPGSVSVPLTVRGDPRGDVDP